MRGGRTLAADDRDAPTPHGTPAHRLYFTEEKNSSGDESVRWGVGVTLQRRPGERPPSCPCRRSGQALRGGHSREDAAESAGGEPGEGRRARQGGRGAPHTGSCFQPEWREQSRPVALTRPTRGPTYKPGGRGDRTAWWHWRTRAQEQISTTGRVEKSGCRWHRDSGSFT